MSSPTEARIVTWSWDAAFAEDVSADLVLVRISRGSPRWLSSSLVFALGKLPELMPMRMARDCSTWEQFEEVYREQLDEFTPELIKRKFDVLERHAEGLPIALLCFEQCRSNCHRGIFARWWEEQTGEIVPEWVPPVAAGAPPEPVLQGTLL